MNGYLVTDAQNEYWHRYICAETEEDALTKLAKADGYKTFASWCHSQGRSIADMREELTIVEVNDLQRHLANVTEQPR